MTVEAAAPPAVAGDDDAHIEGTGHEPPAWLRFVSLSAAGGVLAFGWVGVLLAVIGRYRPALAFPLGAVAWAGLLVLARPLYRSAAAPAARTSRAAHVWAAAGVAAVLAVTAWNVSNISQHVLINRDGGSYVNTGRWIARDGSLEVHPRVGPFATEPGLEFESFAVYEMPDGSLQFQFSHLLPVVLAEARSVAGDRGMFRIPPVLGGIALLAFFVLAWLVTRRPAVALAALFALAFLIPQVSFSRDAYSEIPSQIFLFSGLAALTSDRVLPGWRCALVGGLFLGGLQATRIDALAFLVGVPFVCGLAWIWSRHRDRAATVRSIGAIAAGLAPGLALGLVDLTHRSGNYFDDLSSNVDGLARAAVAACVVAVIGAVAVVWLRPRVPRALPAFAAVAAAAVLVAALVAWVWRPRWQTFHDVAIEHIGNLQEREGRVLDPTRRYFEFSMQWMWWYLGKTTLAAGLVGAALVTWKVIVGTGHRLVAFVCVLAPPSVMYLWRARALPDHVWVDRRFLAGAFPLLILLAALLAAQLAEWRPRRLPAGPRAVAVLIVVMAVAHPLYALRNVHRMQEQARFAGVVTGACDLVGSRAALVVLENADDPASPLFDDWVPQALRSWCGADVAIIRGRADPSRLVRMARAWEREGRVMWVASASPATITAVFPDVRPAVAGAAFNARRLESTIGRRPDGYETESFSMSVARVPIA
jgi:hypothetical protein